MLGVIKDLSSSDITALCLDVRNQGRTYYVGDNGGFLASINFRAKAVITSTQASSSEVSCIGLLPGTDNFIVIGCHDGSAAVVRDTGEHLVVTAWRLNDCFGGGMAVNKLAVCVTSWCSLVVCISNKAKWCIWNTTQGLATAIGEEKSNLTAVELVGTSTRSLSEDEDHAERLITFAIGSSSAIYIYTMDMLESKCFCSLSLNSDSPAYINSFTILHLGPSAINYSNPYGTIDILLAFDADPHS
jgi:WD40 repeat protein